jgi:hypothetical protein
MICISNETSLLIFKGAAYNLLLNTISKFMATLAACISLVCYTSTAVVSAASATSYAAAEFGSFPFYWVTLGILGRSEMTSMIRHYAINSFFCYSHFSWFERIFYYCSSDINYSHGCFIYISRFFFSVYYSKWWQSDVVQYHIPHRKPLFQFILWIFSGHVGCHWI